MNNLFTVKNATLALTTDDTTYGTYPSYQLSSETENSRGAYFPLTDVPESGAYVIEFDAAVSPSTTTNNNSQTTEFAVITGDEPTSSNIGWSFADACIFSLASLKGSETWYLNPTSVTDTAITGTNTVKLTKETMYHYKLEIDSSANTAKLTITDASGTVLNLSNEGATSTAVESLTITPTSGESVTPIGIRIKCGRYRKDNSGYTTKQSIDNIVVYSN